MSFKIGNIEANGNILQWNGNSIAINKINSVDITYSKRKFPVIAIILIILGILISSKIIVALILIAVGALWIYWWSQHKLFDYTVNLRTSSAEPFSLPFGENVSAAEKVKHAILSEMS